MGLARDSVACLACALELYVFLHLMIRDDGIPITSYGSPTGPGWPPSRTRCSTRGPRGAPRDSETTSPPTRRAGFATTIRRRSRPGCTRSGPSNASPPSRSCSSRWCTGACCGVRGTAPVSPHNVIAHGALYAVTLVDFATLNRFTLARAEDLTNAYVYGVVYIFFNVAYTFVPEPRTTGGQVHLPHNGLALTDARVGWVHRRRVRDRVAGVVVRDGSTDAVEGFAVVPEWTGRGRTGTGRERTAGDDGRGNARSFA